MHKKKTKTGVHGTTWKRQMPLSNIHLSKGYYPQSDTKLKHFSIISDMSHISQVYADKPKQ